MQGLPEVERVIWGSCCYFESLGGTVCLQLKKVEALTASHVIRIHHKPALVRKILAPNIM